MSQSNPLSDQELQRQPRPNPRPRQLGQLLLDLGILARPQLEKALEVQRLQPPDQRQPLGLICVDQAFFTRERLNRLLDRWGKRLRLGELLIHRGRLTPSQLDAALAVQKRTGGRLGAIMIEMGLINDAILTETLAEQYDLASIPVDQVDPTPDLVRYINPHYAWRHGVVPISRFGRRLTVVVSDPTRTEIVRDLEHATGLQIQPILSTASNVYSLARRLYGNLDEKGLPNDRTVHEVSPTDVDEHPIEVLGRLVSQARSMHADQLLLESSTSSREVRVLLQKEGRARPSSANFGEELPGIPRVIKNLARLESAETERPQEGMILVPVREEEGGTAVPTKVTVTTNPGPLVETIWMRITGSNEPRPTVERVGLSGLVKERLLPPLDGAEGTFLIVGPAGSRKRQMLRAVVGRLAKQGRDIYTAEEPILWNTPGFVQEEIDPSDGRSYPRLLERFFQQKASIVMLERLADRETAQTVYSEESRRTLILTTLNASTATSIVPRLVGFGVDPIVISRSLTGVLAQRLVRRNCRYCEEVYEPRCSVLDEWFQSEVPDISWKRSTGCANCRGTGFSGRILVSELWIPNDAERCAIAGSEEGTDLRRLVRKRMRCIGQAVLEETIAGRTTLEEGLKSVPYEDVVHTRLHGLGSMHDRGTGARIEGAA